MAEAEPQAPTGVRTGRRPGSPGTRDDILDAARTLFARHGFAGATVRAVAAEAGVDPALVHHYFGTKKKLFLEATLDHRRPRDVLDGLHQVPADQVGEHAVTFVLSLWEGAGGERMAALLRTAATDQQAATILRSVIVEEAIVPLLADLGVPPAQQQTRAALMAATMMGLALGRYVLRLPGLVELPAPALVMAYAPVLQRFADGDLVRAAD